MLHNYSPLSQPNASAKTKQQNNQVIGRVGITCRLTQNLSLQALVFEASNIIEKMLRIALSIACDGEGDPAKRRSGEARLLAILHVSSTNDLQQSKLKQNTLLMHHLHPLRSNLHTGYPINNPNKIYPTRQMLRIKNI
jgi:hypothetical protein